MEKIELEEKLTPAAKQALYELIEDYKNRILIAARDSASRLTGEMQEISVHDILAGVDCLDHDQVRRRPQLPRTIELFLRVYAGVGLVMAAVGIIFLLYGNISVVNSEQRTALLLSLGGSVIFALSYAFLRLRRLRTLREGDIQDVSALPDTFSTRFVKQWQAIELAVRSVASSRLGESSAKEPISVLFHRLGQNGVLEPEDESILKQLMGLRNVILHEGRRLNREEFDRATKQAGRVLGKLISP